MQLQLGDIVEYRGNVGIVAKIYNDDKWDLGVRWIFALPFSSTRQLVIFGHPDCDCVFGGSDFGWDKKELVKLGHSE